ncbi:hypothetical protein Leryth_002277 [Lithospermum erythrorhizon]|nr:hypothetical protein Leryth_002277 [Lithospermum erythrorhizon]
MDSLNSSEDKNFALPVDSEHKATEFWPLLFFPSSVTTLISLQPTSETLALQLFQVHNIKRILTFHVSGATRVAMGTACDLFGPRLASASLTLLTAPAVYCSAIVNTQNSFLLVRFFTGFSLATFVSTQFPGWSSWRFFLQLLLEQLMTLSAYVNFSLGSLALTYGYCFGVELTVDNIIAQYFYDRFNTNLHTAGIIAASFGLANLFSRPGGGWFSDVMARRFGMRGRLWALWIVQTIGGLLCILLGKVSTLSASVVVMLVFSVFVQAACGLTFGVVPFVSRRSLGIISGMTGAGGNVGAVLTQVIFFRGSHFETETGITLMGVMMICCTIPILFIYFPQWGGMFWGPSSKGTTEEDYYMSEWSPAEKSKGFHNASLKFADNSRSERGKRVGAAPTQQTTPSAVV